MKTHSYTPNRYLMQPSQERCGTGDFQPRPARHPAEIARRRCQRRGTLVLEEQSRGLEVIGRGLEATTSTAEAEEWADCMALAGVGTSPYLLNGAVMNRHVPLPVLAHENPKQRPSSEALRDQAISAFREAGELTSFLTVAHRIGTTAARKEALQLETGRKIAHASFLLACIKLGDFIADPTNEISNAAAQMQVRDTCMETVQRSSILGIELRAFPSAAQIADPLSPLGVEIQKAGSDSVEQLYLAHV